MKNIYLKVFLSLILGGINSLIAQESNEQMIKNTLKSAQSYAKLANIEEEINCYKKLLSYDSTNFNYYQKLGTLFLDDQENYKEAAKYFEKQISIQHDTSAIAAKSLGTAYHHMSDYSKALLFYKKYNKLTNPADQLEKRNVGIQKGIDNCTYAMSNTIISDSIEVKNLGLKTNSAFDDYSPVYNFKDSSLYYTSRRPSNLYSPKESLDNKYFENIYKSKSNSNMKAAQVYFQGNAAVNFTDQNVHKSIIGFNNANDSIFIYYDNKIWKLKYDKNDTWNSPSQKLFSNSDIITHFSASDSNNLICFALEKAKEFGNRDIYYQTKNTDGTSTEMKKFGPEINTPFEENCPFVSKNGKTIYFASQGLPGYGGYDLYSINFENGAWSAPQNLGLPINSSANDMYYFESPETGAAYFSSDRIGGLGLQDIYKVVEVQKKYLEFDPKSLEYSFDISKSIDPYGLQIKYEWDFDDGSKGFGTKITHQFNQPKKYKVVINGIDTINNIRDNNLSEIEVDLSNETFLTIEAEDSIVYAQKNILFNASNCVIKDSKILKIDWKLPDNKLLYNQNTANFKFDKSGTYIIQINIKAKSNVNSEINYYTFSKKINVHEK